MRRGTLILACAVIFVLALTSQTNAGAPQLINYQGVLADSTGAGLDTTVNITFSIYENAVGLTPIWVEAHAGVIVTGGLFNVLLGSTTPLDVSIFGGSILYLGITIGADPEISPRTQLVSVPYSFNSEHADEADLATLALQADTADFADTAALAVLALVAELAIFADSTRVADSLDGFSSEDFSLTGHSHGGGGGGWTDIGTVVRLDAAGDSVGIGTSSPSEKLDVVGNIVVNGKAAIGPGNSNIGLNAFVTGSTNSASGDYSTVSGSEDTASGTYATIGGGWRNLASGSQSTIAGGRGNVADLLYSTIGGGFNNKSQGSKATVAGGAGNSALATSSTVGGGENNTASGIFSTVAGGQSNIADTTSSTVGGGRSNESRGVSSTVAGGRDNNALGDWSTISGGIDNIADTNYSTIAGGRSNQARGTYSAVVGGWVNRALGNWSFIGGGEADTASGSYSTVCGGSRNIADMSYSTIGGGLSNQARGTRATVAGGQDNIAQGTSSTIPGGINNSALGHYSFAAGRRAKANHAGAFVWGDSFAGDVTSSATDQFTVRASGGVRFYSNTALTLGVTLSAGGGAWVAVSDSAVKRNIRLVDEFDILEKVARLPISRWSYETQSPDIEHIGPMSQDFYAAFGLGENEKGISTLDPDGVALAAIKALYNENKELKKQIQSVQAESRDEIRKLEKLLRELLDNK